MLLEDRPIGDTVLGEKLSVGWVVNLSLKHFSLAQQCNASMKGENSSLLTYTLLN